MITITSIIYTFNKKLYINLYNKISNKFSELLSIVRSYSNKHIGNDINIIHLLELFMSNNQFNFFDVNIQIKEHNNIIDKYCDSINKCKNDIIEWKDQFKNIVSLLESDKLFQNSCNTYNLIISRTNWKEELENNNIIGLLVNLITPKLSKLGIVMNKVKIIEISNNFITLETLCESQDIFKSSYNKYDDGRNTFHAIYGNALGNGNSIFPLYINETHWKLVKTQINYCLGLSINQNPFNYYNRFYEVYPMIYLKLVMNIIMMNNISDKDIITFIQLTLTVNKIFEEILKNKINGYSFDHLTNTCLRDNYNINNLDHLLGLTMINYNKNISDKINKFKNKKINEILMEEIRRKFKSLYDTHVPLNIEYIDIINIWQYYFNINPIYNAEPATDVIIEIIKYKIENNLNIPLIFKEILLNPILYDSLYKIMCWKLINEINNNKTIIHLNKVLINKNGNINDNTIMYFKKKFTDLNKKYNEYRINDNLLSFLGINNNYKIRFQTLILQSMVCRNKKYFKDHYIYNPLIDTYDNIYKYYLTLIKPYIISFYNNLSYHMYSNSKMFYIYKLVSLMKHINFECNNSYYDIILKLNDFGNSINNIIVNNIESQRKKHIDNNKQIILNAMFHNRKDSIVETNYILDELIASNISLD
jgi:hypothetical protein